MKCHYEVLGVSIDCSSDDLKKAYRKLALEWHPDKNLHRQDEAHETFQLIQQAYETLSDPQERAWYDRHKDDILRGGAEEAYKDDSLNVYQYFNSSCFKGYNDDEKGFYTVYRQVFEKIAAEDKPFVDSDEEIDVPSFGYSDSSYKEVVHDFYAYWQSYCTAKSFSWHDQYDLTEARRSGAGRQVIRLMEKDNKKLREQHRKARNEEVRALVAFVRKRDKRVQEHKKKEEERKIEKAKRAEELRKQQILEQKKSLSNYKESEWVSKSNLEDRFNELESTIDATFGTPSTNDAAEDDDTDALYCVACEKDFRSEKAMKNHENSKKHKENVALLKYLMEEEEAAHQNNVEEVDVNEDPKVSESEDEETSEALLVELVRSSSSKNKKKKKKNKNVPLETTLNVDNEDEEELSSKLEEITVDDPPEVQNTDTKLSTKNKKRKTCFLMKKKKKIALGGDGSNKKDKKSKSKKEKVPTVNVPSESTEQVTKEPPTTICEKCNQDFKTRNKLFSHLKESGHAVYKTENPKQNSSGGSTKKKKKKKL
ncbi:dnaJ homolog subfamily C member 21 [Caerostris darwini]|uniref:DnaJ homolog subfamily C member 21 n=1 Tax=Caerostris darwini TaxID=1538125 RepID=A0AAV4UPA0_9ARAC|nr:dnaJ homolog subfamily C member 21 [Caerostris darwini]